MGGAVRRGQSRTRGSINHPSCGSTHHDPEPLSRIPDSPHSNPDLISRVPGSHPPRPRTPFPRSRRRAFGRIGSAYQKLDNLPEAIKYYSKSLTEHRTPEILAKLQEVEKEKKRRDREAYIDPAKSDEEREKGNTHFKNGDWPAAVASFTYVGSKEKWKGAWSGGPMPIRGLLTKWPVLLPA